MKIVLNDDADLVKEISRKLKENDGYCPCRVMHAPSNKCMCEEFRKQVADPEWYGECHCGLYVKVL